jgi:hypothetical protein
MDWPTFSQHCDETLAAIKDRAFVRALTDRTGTLLVTAEGDEIHLPEFTCGGSDVLAAHFTANVLERAGFGDHATIKALLTHCGELFAFRRTDGSFSVYAHARGSPPVAKK